MLHRLYYKPVVVLLTLFFLSSSVFGTPPQSTQIPDSTRELVKFSAAFQPSAVRYGEKFRLEIQVSLKKDWHIYSVVPQKEEDAPPPTKVVLSDNFFDVDGPVYETRPKRESLQNLGFSVIYHEKKAVLYQNIALKKNLLPGEHKAKIIIYFQACTDAICLPTDSRTEWATFRVEQGEPRSEYLIAERGIDPLPEVGGLTRMLSGGFWAFIALAAFMGLASLLTPCVFPMIPITVSFFSKQAEGRYLKVLKLATLFAFGIIFTYTGTGLLLSALFGAGSALLLAANPFVNLVIALVFILFALSLMGFFEFSLPGGVEAYFDQKARKMGGVAGVLLMGFTFTLTAFTCTVQFVGTMLIAAAQGEWIWPLIGMLVFSTVFAFPFFLLAVVPGLIKKMQGKSGAWLGRSKVVLGILELMASIKFLSNADLVWQIGLISRNTAILIWIALLVVIIVYLLWTGLRPSINRSPFQWGSVLIFSIGIVLLARGWDDRSLGSLIDAVLPPPSGLHLSAADFVSEEESNKVIWLDSLDEAKILAKSKNQQILLEFTGYTCVNCRWMEQNVLTRKDVHQKLTENFVLVRLYTDGGENASNNLELQINHFNTVALPFYIILTSDGISLREFSGISLDPKEFLDFLTL